MDGHTDDDGPRRRNWRPGRRAHGRPVHLGRSQRPDGNGPHREGFPARRADLRAAREHGRPQRPGLLQPGNRPLKARQYDPALGIFLRAERYLGSNPEIRRNLLLALAGDDKDAELSLPWYRFFLFWHYGLSAAARLTIAVVAWAVFWAGLILRVLGAPRLARPLVLGGILAVALFGSSVAASLYQEVNERAVRINPDATLTAPARPAKSPGKTVTNVRSETRK